MKKTYQKPVTIDIHVAPIVMNSASLTNGGYTQGNVTVADSRRGHYFDFDDEENEDFEDFED